MELTTFADMEQSTIGPADLSQFVEVISSLNHGEGKTASAELTKIAFQLEESLEAWKRSLVNNGLTSAAEGFDATGDGQLQAASTDDKLAALRTIDRHLSRLIDRHSNFGFGAANAPDPLDMYFPGDALAPVRIARPLVRKAIAELDKARAS